MTVKATGDGAIILEGACGAEDAEHLFQLLCDEPAATVALGGAVTVHTAVWQVLLLLKPAVEGSPGRGLSAEQILGGNVDVSPRFAMKRSNSDVRSDEGKSI